jgi:homoserine O-acetyltransferase
LRVQAAIAIPERGLACGFEGLTRAERRLMIETIRQDAGYNNGDYAAQPKAMKLANVFYATATSGGTLAYQKLAPTREKADRMVDERNPPETGITEAAMKRVKNGRLLLIPASEDTRGHGTTGMAKFYAKELQAFLQSASRRGPSSN